MHADVITLPRGPLFERAFFYLRHGETDIELNALALRPVPAAAAGAHWVLERT